MKRVFKNKTAVVTGAAGGIGSSITGNLLNKGCNVIALDLSEKGLSSLQDRYSEYKNLYTFAVDITDYEKLKIVYLDINKKYGSIDFLFNNAGAVHRSMFADTDIAVFKKVLDVNLWGSVYLTKLFLDDLVENRGAIVITSSVAGFAPLYGRTFYSGSKFALHGVFETLRTELKDKGVTVTIVSPSFTKTSFEQAALDGDGNNLTKKRKKVGKYLSPDIVAGIIVKSVAKNRRFVVISQVGKLSLVMRKCVPVLYDFLMVRSVKDEFDVR